VLISDAAARLLKKAAETRSCQDSSAWLRGSQEGRKDRQDPGVKDSKDPSARRRVSYHGDASAATRGIF